MTTIYGTIPPATVLKQFAATSVRVRRWVDIYNSDNVTPYLLNVPVQDGNVSVDSTRAERRNLDLTLYDDGTLAYGPGYLWYDKIFKPFRGIQLDDVPVDGYLYMPNLSGTNANHLSITRTALSSCTQIEFAVKILPATTGVLMGLAGWGNGDAVFELQATNKLLIQGTKTAGIVGGGLSTVAVPGITAGVPIWLRGIVVASTGACSYYYSNDTTDDYDAVNWVQVGTTVTGTTGTLILTNSSTVYFGSEGATTAIVRGGIYCGYEGISTAKTIEFDCTDISAAATSFVAITGQTVTLNQNGTDFAAFIPKSKKAGDVWVTCLGEFYPDVIERPRFPKSIHITGRDATKKLLLSKFGQTTSFAAGTNVSTTIKNIATNGGISKFNFVTDTQTMGSIVTFDRSDARWKGMSDLATSIGMDLFFDAYGYLTLRPFVDPLTAPLYYTFQTGQLVGNLVDYSRSTTDARMFNRVVVYGDSNSNPLVWGEAANTTITSPTRIAAIGERLADPIANGFVVSNAAAAAIALQILKVVGLEQYEVKISSICVPWMEGGVAVEAILPDSAVSDPTRFLFTDFSIPMTLDAMSGTARRVTIVG